MAALLAGICSFGYAQDYKNAPKANEIVIGVVSTMTGERKEDWTEQQLYLVLLKKAQTEYPNKTIDIREMQKNVQTRMVKDSWPSGGYSYDVMYKYELSGKVVTTNPVVQTNESLSQALNKALRNVREGSRLAIDQVSVNGSMDKETLKDQLIDALLDKGYKVVAKEYLERLYKEQQDQQSGIYNDRTTVQGDNFSAVGYYINVKVTETLVRVQVVNVSTGEYEGNATVNF